MTKRYTVITENNAWSYVLRDGKHFRNGPWRYRWEAQDEADRLNEIEEDGRDGR